MPRAPNLFGPSWPWQHRPVRVRVHLLTSLRSPRTRSPGDAIRVFTAGSTLYDDRKVSCAVDRPHTHVHGSGTHSIPGVRPTPVVRASTRSSLASAPACSTSSRPRLCSSRRPSQDSPTDKSYSAFRCSSHGSDTTISIRKQQKRYAISIFKAKSRKDKESGETNVCELRKAIWILTKLRIKMFVI